MVTEPDDFISEDEVPESGSFFQLINPTAEAAENVTDGSLTPLHGTTNEDRPTPQSGATVDVFDVTTEVPRSGTKGFYTTRRVPGTHDQETRKLIALIILSLVAVLYAAIIFFFLAGWIDTEKLTAAIAAMSGIQALAAAAIGFYYGSKQE